MRKICFLFLMLFCFSGTAFSMQDIYHLYPYETNTNSQEIYNRYEGINFNYELRDMYPTSSISANIPAGQWFAVVRENYFRNFWYWANNQRVSGDIDYRRTLGGDIPEISINALADLLDDYNYVLVEEPEPYNTWRNYNVNINDYDDYPDPVEAFCLVIKNGEGELNLNFGNQFARHFPFWWGRGTQEIPTPNYVRWQDYAYTEINGPIAFIISGDRKSVYTRNRNNATNSYQDVLTLRISGDISGGVSSDKVYNIYDTERNLKWKVSDDEVYDSNGTLTYKVDTAKGNVNNTSGNTVYIYRDYLNAAGQTYTYIFEMSAIQEQVATINEDNTNVMGLGDSYTVDVLPYDFSPVNPGEYLNAKVTLNARNPQDYSSSLGYINFQQRGDLAYGYKNFSEASLVPFVVANVYDGAASTNHPLEFEMRIFDNNNDIVDVKHFTWSVNSNNTPDIGTFYTMRPNISSMPSYETEMKITNHTSTRYRVHRYDNSAREISPAYWEYDLPSNALTLQNELNLPSRFWLDSHSQIAPGLVTVYNDFTINTAYDTTPIFSIYASNLSTPQELRLNYKSITGMTTSSPSRLYSQDIVVTQGFYMGFADDTDLKNTVRDLTDLLGKPPVMSSLDNAVTALLPTTFTAGSGMLAPFEIRREVPLGLISMDRVIISADEDSEDVSENTSEDVISIDVPAEVALQPVKIRFILSRYNSLIGNHWQDLESASTKAELLNKFSEFASIWFRSGATDRRMASLFTAMSNQGVNIEECVNAFIYENNLYLDFIVFLADSDWSHQEAGKTAYIKFFSDDDNRYILIGDGNIDGIWNIGFFVGANDYTSEENNNNSNNNPEDNNNNNVYPPYHEDNTNSSSGGGGGGCNSGLETLGILLLIKLCFTKKRF